MPPKGGGGPSKKNVDKAAKKVAEDKTFGLKNKNKSKKIQQFVQQVTKQVHENANAVKSMTPEQKAALEIKKAKAEKERMDKELAQLLKTSIKQKPLEAGVDPKSVLCEFFKQGCCDKGAKCKFSHDLTLFRKGAKLNIYADKREGGDGAPGEEKKEDNIADWDQAKLESVVETKHSKDAAKVQTTTDIVCKYFLDAIEKEIYGWFWICPGGGDACKYRHALPPGYVFKTKKQRELEAAQKLEMESEEIDIGQLIEEERQRLPTTGLTKVTAETFKAWKEKRDKRKLEEMKNKQEDEAKKGQAGGRDFRVLSGRALFTYDPSLFIDDADADADVYSDDGGEDEEADNDGAGAADADGERMYDAEDGSNAAAGSGSGEGGKYDASAFLDGGDDVDLDDIDDDEGDGDGDGEEE